MTEVVSEGTAISGRARRMLMHEDHGLAYRLMDTLDISALRAYDLLHEMKLYLLLCALNPGEELPVPLEIDRALHLFIEHPEFETFCRECAQGTIEHTPHEAPMSWQDRERTLGMARMRYAGHFNARLWSQGLPVCTCRFTAKN